MESNSKICPPQKRFWILRQSVNKDYLKSCLGFLSVCEMVSLVTSFIGLLHYVRIVTKTTVANHVFFVTTGVIFALKLVIFLVVTFNLHQKVITSNKHWNLLMVLLASFAAVILLISSSLLASEAVTVGDAFHSTNVTHAKCQKCSKINIAAVFGFISCFLFMTDLCVCIRQNEFSFCWKRETRVTVHHVPPVSENGQESTVQP